MEHIVQFAVGIDDDRIQKLMEEAAAKQIIDEIKEFSHGKTYYGNNLNNEPKNLREIFKEEIAQYVKEHADEIISMVVTELSKNMMKTKKVKEAIEEVTK